MKKKKSKFKKRTSRGSMIQDFLDGKPMSRFEHEQSVAEYQKAIGKQASILQRRGLWIQRLIAIIAILLIFNLFLILTK